MSATTSIEWTDRTWNPVTGCTKVSAGCDHCYAETMHERFNGKGSFANVKHHSDRLHLPQRWRKPSRIFVNSMSDLFHDAVSDEFIAEVWAVMALTQRHTFQVLTKRHGRMRSLLNSSQFWTRVTDACRARGEHYPAGRYGSTVPNVWLGVSVEDQSWASIRVPALLETPAAVRWISAEPLLGPIDLYGQQDAHGHRPHRLYAIGPGQPYFPPGPPGSFLSEALTERPTLDWVVAGGESGPGARPMHPGWARSLRDQCAEAGVPFLFKQWGAHDATGKRVGKKAAGRELDGRTHDGYPDVTA